MESSFLPGRGPDNTQPKLVFTATGSLGPPCIDSPSWKHYNQPDPMRQPTSKTSSDLHTSETQSSVKCS